MMRKDALKYCEMRPAMRVMHRWFQYFLTLMINSYVRDGLKVIIIIIKGIYIAQVRKGHKCAMSAEMAVWLRNCLYLYSYLSHN